MTNSKEKEIFVNRLSRDVSVALEKNFPNTTSKIQEVSKLQGKSYTALSLIPEKENKGVHLNLDSLYGEIQSGKSYEDVLELALKQAKEGLAYIPKIDVLKILSSYEDVKDKLYVTVVGTQTNREVLKKVPHTDIEDLSIVYKINVPMKDNNSASILIDNDFCTRMGITEAQLHADALASATKMHPASIKSLNEVICGLMGVSIEELPEIENFKIYVVTNMTKWHGAAVVFYPGVMENVAREIGGNFFILPSSVHEMLFVPDNGNMDADSLREMVSMINANEVAPCERLTDSVYYYDADKKKFETAF